MKIAVIARIINQNSGARAPIRLAEQLAHKGHRVDFFAYDTLLDKEVLKSLKNQGIKVFVIKIPSYRLVGNLVAAWRLWQTLRGRKYDFLTTHVQTPLQIATYLSGSGMVLRTHYGIQYSSRTILKQAGIKFEITLMQSLVALLWDLAAYWDQFISIKFAHQHTTISRFLQTEIKKQYGQDATLIYLGSEVPKFGLAHPRPLPKSKEVKILSVSRIVPYKGFDLLIKMVKKLSKQVPNLRLIIIGSVADPIYLEKLKKMQTTQIDIVMNPSDELLAQYYREADIYASGDLWVPWSLTPLEASYFSKPLLGFDRGAMPEIIVSGENGLLAKKEKEYEVNLLMLIKDKGLRDEMGKRARELVRKRFNWSRCADEYLKLGGPGGNRTPA